MKNKILYKVFLNSEDKIKVANLRAEESGSQIIYSESPHGDYDGIFPKKNLDRLMSLSGYTGFYTFSYSKEDLKRYKEMILQYEIEEAEERKKLAETRIAHLTKLYSKLRNSQSKK